jgi:hypothetical protein
MCKKEQKYTATGLPMYGWMPHNASFGFLDIPSPNVGQIHY